MKSCFSATISTPKTPPRTAENPAAFPAWYNDSQYAGWGVALQDHPDSHNPSHWLAESDD